MVDFKPSKGHAIQVHLGNGIIKERHICEWEFITDSERSYRCKLKFSTGDSCNWVYELHPGMRLPENNIGEIEIREQPDIVKLSESDQYWQPE